MQLNKTQKSLLIALLVSIFFIHLPALWVLKSLDISERLEKSHEKKPKTVMVNLKQPERKRIADIQKPKRQRRPKKATAQSKYNSSVKKEQVARGIDRRPQRSQPQTQKQPKLEKGTSKQEVKKQPKDLRQALAALSQAQEQKEAKALRKYDSAASMDLSKLRSSVGSSGAHLRGIKVGNRTFINTEANPNVSYFVELKRKFRTTWNPRGALRKDRSGLDNGRIVTVWGLSVDRKGSLKRLLLLRRSGNPTFDHEARRTIRDSSPFRIPPGHLLAKDGELHMAWTFVVYK